MEESMRAIDQLTDKDREVIGQMREAIQKRGHYQGGGSPGQESRACLVVNTPLRQQPMAREARILEAIQEAAEIVSEGGGTRTVAWNDSVETDEVIDVLTALEVG